MTVVTILLLAVLSLATEGQTDNQKKIPVLIPHVRPDKVDIYYCAAVRLDPNQEYFVTAFEPNATMKTVHHMAISGCGKPGSDADVWNCGGNVLDSRFPFAGVCRNYDEIIYAWARDAPTVELPEGVGFKVGGSTPIQYLVVLVHYASLESFRDGSTDDSGVIISYTKTPQPRTAGVLLLGVGGNIYPGTSVNLETACTIEEDKVIHAFAFRIHAHSHGRVVSGYKVTHDETDHWELIAAQDPQLPHMFYPLTKQMVIRSGDTVAARCAMVNNGNRTVTLGFKGDDEMCNFYIMYWVDSQQYEPLKRKTCFTGGPPYSWKTDTTFKNVPDNL